MPTRATPFLPRGVRSRDATRFRVTHIYSAEKKKKEGEREEEGKGKGDKERERESSEKRAGKNNTSAVPVSEGERGKRDRSFGRFLFSDLATQEGSPCRMRFTRVDARETGRRRYRRVDSLSIIIERAGNLYFSS